MGIALAEDEPASPPAAAPEIAEEGDVGSPSTRPQGLTAAEFREMIEPHRGRLERCVRPLGDDAAPRVSVRISREGSVKSVRLGAEVPYVVERCIASALEGLRFPRAEGSSNHTLILRDP